MKLTREYFENHPQWKTFYEDVKGKEPDGSDDMKLWTASLYHKCGGDGDENDHVGLVDLHVSNCMYEWRFAIHGDINSTGEGYFSGFFFACTVEELEEFFKLCHFDIYKYSTQLYRCKSNGKLYEKIQDHLLAKTIIESERIYYADSFDLEFKDTYKWDHLKKDKLVLYKATYADCLDGPYFVRYKEDFDKEFEIVK